MPFFIGGIVLLLLLLVAARGFVNTDPARLGRFIRWFLISLGAFGACAVVVLLVASDRLGPALALMGFLAPVIVRGRTVWRRWQNAAGPRAGNTSEATTHYLRMRLDHDTGGMSGTVLKGRFAGRRLDELAESDLIELWRECRLGDEASARLMESYLDRLGADWRGAAGADARSGASPNDTMTREEALAILGLVPGATAAQVKEAHRSLMMKLHPDHGGSTYLAAKINRAKEILLDA